jgi:hypothetical protein
MARRKKWAKVPIEKAREAGLAPPEPFTREEMAAALAPPAPSGEASFTRAEMAAAPPDSPTDPASPEATEASGPPAEEASGDAGSPELDEPKVVSEPEIEAAPDLPRPGSGPRPKRKYTRKVAPETTQAAQAGMAALLAQSAMVVSLTMAQALDPIWDLSEPGPANEDGTPTRKPGTEAIALGAAINDLLPEIANDPWVKLGIVAGSIILPRTVITMQNRAKRRGVYRAPMVVSAPPPVAADPPPRQPEPEGPQSVNAPWTDPKMN